MRIALLNTVEIIHKGKLMNSEGKAHKSSSEHLSFSEALNLVKVGNKLSRLGWDSKSMFIFLVSGSTFEVNRKPLLGIYPEGTVINYHSHIDMKISSGEIVPWVASQSDLLSDDWFILNDVGV